ncbi:unnamed protein product [Rhizoctonia solani]|uniref:DUF6606 domain-containing protein n=1 Tax=Rhizoctonia solani TaxID=456999 RepID=A0A8H3GGG3_9AGAM|nr:unnamed protein product [Rhizoctonia solani]
MSTLTDLSVLEHLVYNVFLPPKLPQEEPGKSFQKSVDLAIIHSVIRAGHEYSVKSGVSDKWSRIELMLKKLCRYVEDSLKEVQLNEDMKGMGPQESLLLYIQAQNAGLFIRKHSDYTSFEVFEAQAQAEELMSTSGKIVRQYPGPAVQVANSVADDRAFIDEVANILSRMSQERLFHAFATTWINDKGVNGTANPNYFAQYFLGFLRGMGSIFDPPLITKRLADEVLWLDATKPWRRSPIWLLVRVALQTSLNSTIEYKHFICYYHASILSECNKRIDFPSDLLYAMRVKTARRLYKARDTAPEFLIHVVKDAGEVTQDLIQGRWDKVQAARKQSRNQDFNDCKFHSATNQTLPNSLGYLKQVFESRPSNTTAIPHNFAPKHSPRLENIIEFCQYADGGLTQAFGNDPELALYDFETSVIENLPYWTSKRHNYFEACSTISSCFKQYSTAAKSYYSTDVADQSIMFLILIRLWMAIDELAIRECPLLSEFSPELPEDILDSLLLRTSEFLELARLVQQYIRGRHAKASSENTSIFSGNIASSSFEVQFFRSSSRHQRIKMDIEEKAQEQRDKKIAELNELNSRSKQLNIESLGMAHQYYEASGSTDQLDKRGDIDKRKRHSEFCVRCLKEKERDGLRIQLHEWPLPPEQIHAEAVVFELDPPEAFCVWRDITYEILVDLGTLHQRPNSKQHGALEAYNALVPWLSTAAFKPRITIASTVSLKELRCDTLITLPALEDKVCVKNPLHFQFYDRNRRTWACGPFSNTEFARYGTLKLPSKSLYSHLTYALERTTHTSNQVLADQHDCPKDLSLHEHTSFGQILIDSKSLGRLPPQYMENATYIRLFGQKILDVVPANSPGMEFTTKKHIYGYKVSLGFEKKNGNQKLIIQAQKKDGPLYELIPHETLSEDLPFFFSNDYHHWANTDKKFIEFHPISTPWLAEAYQWILSFDTSWAATLKNTTDDSLLIDVHSTSYERISQSICPLESDHYLHVTYSAKGQVEVELPRMKLSFFINQDKQLESHNFRGQVIDVDQSAGTLFGLRNQLLLRAKGAVAQSLPRSRFVLIPSGEVEFKLDGDHVLVLIKLNAHRNVEFYRYLVDEDLGYLETSEGLTSRLFKIYLHALTSYCLPDTLTGRTGTEEALYELSQASTSSFEQINLEQAKLLKAIGLLTPRYTYHPEDLKCMQAIKWADISFLSQHFAFSTAVTEILDYADTLRIFHPLEFKLEQFIASLKTSGTLLQRATRRSALYYSSDATGHVSPLVNYGPEIGNERVKQQVGPRVWHIVVGETQCSNLTT